MGKNVVVIGTQWGDEGKGKIVDLLTDRAYVAGEHVLNWNAEGRPSGLYFYRVTAGEHVSVNKMMLMK